MLASQKFIFLTVGKRAKRMQDTTVETTTGLIPFNLLNSDKILSVLKISTDFQIVFLSKYSELRQNILA